MSFNLKVNQGVKKNKVHEQQQSETVSIGKGTKKRVENYDFLPSLAKEIAGFNTGQPLS